MKIGQTVWFRAPFRCHNYGLIECYTLSFDLVTTKKSGDNQMPQTHTHAKFHWNRSIRSTCSVLTRSTVENRVGLWALSGLTSQNHQNSQNCLASDKLEQIDLFSATLSRIIIIIQFIADTQSIYYITESYRQKDKWERLKKISHF